MNSYNKHSNSNAKGKRVSYAERNDPLQKLIRIINQYHSIDLIEHATNEEKNWAKERLYKDIIYTLKSCSSDIQGRIKASIKNKSIWENVRDDLE